MAKILLPRLYKTTPVVGCQEIMQILNRIIVEDKTWELFLAKYYGLI